MQEMKNFILSIFKNVFSHVKNQKYCWVNLPEAGDLWDSTVREGEISFENRKDDKTPVLPAALRRYANGV